MVLLMRCYHWHLKTEFSHGPSLTVEQYSHYSIRPIGAHMTLFRSATYHVVSQSHTDCLAMPQNPAAHVVGVPHATDVFHRPRNGLLWHTIPAYRYATHSSRR